MASLLRLKSVAESFINKGADANAQGGHYGNTLQVASSEGHDRMVQMLLDKEADIDAQGGEYGNALQAASYGDHDLFASLTQRRSHTLRLEHSHWHLN